MIEYRCKRPKGRPTVNYAVMDKSYIYMELRKLSSITCLDDVDSAIQFNLKFKSK